LSHPLSVSRGRGLTQERHVVLRRNAIAIGDDQEGPQGRAAHAAPRRGVNRLRDGLGTGLLGQLKNGHIGPPIQIECIEQMHDGAIGPSSTRLWLEGATVMQIVKQESSFF
ncbi:hypothetical protein, partial [Henriciella pelagia]|uniref:hypothetical protein n=1 Tax=Henriciella pelagia TaxID=1977912 RepID=UPI003511E22C